MIEKILSFCDDTDMLADATMCLVGVSGGADSMALLEVMREISLSRNFKIIAAHFNHKLRGDESERDENFVRAYCSAENIEC
jgi:tRNA(Ile)-lysidine synthase